MFIYFLPSLAHLAEVRAFLGGQTSRAETAGFSASWLGVWQDVQGLNLGRIMLRTHKQRQQTHKSSPAHWQKLTKTKRWRAKETKRQIATERQTNEDAARTDTNTLTWLLNGPLGGFQKADVGSNNNRLIVYSAGSSSKYCEFRSTLYTSGYLCCHTGRYL